MLPIVSLVGRPNVGKSTLFNLLTCSFNAIVLDVFGTTRDRQYGTGVIGDFSYILIDTGGIVLKNNRISFLNSNILYQVEEAIKESNILLFIIDIKFGLLKEDIIISNYLRTFNKKILLVINKMDELVDNVYLDVYSLGFGHPVFISAKYNKNILKLSKMFLSIIYESNIFFDNYITVVKNTIKISVIGKPNVGKSTLINNMLGKKRLIVLDEPGTTRDSIYVPFKKNNDNYIIVDTAGLRKKKNVIEIIEKFSIIRCIRAVKYSNVVLLLIDIEDGITEQDIKLIKLVIDIGKCLILVFSKCDKIKINRSFYIDNLKHNFPFLNIIIIHFISSHLNIGMYRLFFYINFSYSCSIKKLSSYFLSKLLNDLIIRYDKLFLNIQFKNIYTCGYNPLVFFVYGKNFNKMISSCKRFLINWFIKKLKLIGTPLFIIFKLK